jgi:hypothetical protein
VENLDGEKAKEMHTARGRSGYKEERIGRSGFWKPMTPRDARPARVLEWKSIVQIGCGVPDLKHFNAKSISLMVDALNQVLYV